MRRNMSIRGEGFLKKLGIPPPPPHGLRRRAGAWTLRVAGGGLGMAGTSRQVWVGEQPDWGWMLTVLWVSAAGWHLRLADGSGRGGRPAGVCGVGLGDTDKPDGVKRLIN